MPVYYVQPVQARARGRGHGGCLNVRLYVCLFVGSYVRLWLANEFLCTCVCAYYLRLCHEYLIWISSRAARLPKWKPQRNSFAPINHTRDGCLAKCTAKKTKKKNDWFGCKRSIYQIGFRFGFRLSAAWHGMVWLVLFCLSRGMLSGKRSKCSVGL